MLYCITKKNFRDKLADWPEEEAALYRSMDKRGELHHYTTPEQADKAIPDSLRPLVMVTTYYPF